MRLSAHTRTAALLAVAALAPMSTTHAQERAPEREERVERTERERRREAMDRARERLREAAPRAEAMARAFTFEMAAPDRAVVGVSIGEGTTRGIRVEDVTEDGPAARAGIREGEYLTRVDDVSLRLDEADADDDVMRSAVARRLTRALERLDAGDEVTLGVAGEDGRERTVRVATVRADSLRREGMVSETLAGPMAEAFGWRMDPDRATLGLALAPSGTSRDTLGAFVQSVVQDGPAERAGIYEGHRIAAINGVDLRVAAPDAEDEAVAASRAARLEQAMRDVEAGAAVTLRVWDGRAYRDVRVESAKASEVYERGGAFGGQMFRPVPGGTWRMVVPPSPAAAPRLRTAPQVAPRAAVRAAPRATIRVAPRALTLPRGQVRVVRPARVRTVRI